LSGLGEVLRLADRPGEARVSVEKAHLLFQRKGDRVSAERAEQALAELERGAPADG
jgi:hypothetical protein